VIKVVSLVRLDGDIEASYRAALWRIDELVDRLSRPLTTVPENDAPVPAGGRAQANVPREDHLAAVERAKEYIVAGEAIQVVLSRRLSRRTGAHPINIYRGLRHVNPSPYMFYLDFGAYQLIGASPELLVRVEEGAIDYHPIAGTRPRGVTEAEDSERERELLASEKERAEHIMLVDLGRNDVGRVSVPGSVRVTDLMSVERYSHVMHLVSTVEGDLAPGRTAYDVLQATFPAGTLSGAPKPKAMEIIDKLEPTRRGLYGGTVGYFGFAGDMDMAIAIRTALMHGGVAYVGAGAGIVADSDPASEEQETRNKAAAVLAAIAAAETLRAAR
jgi:anthranilate synthase component 1